MVNYKWQHTHVKKFVEFGSRIEVKRKVEEYRMKGIIVARLYITF